jgi:hypothetical protein
MSGALISVDQKWIAATSPSGPVLVPVDRGAARPIRGMQPGDSVPGWTSDGQLYVANGTPRLRRIDTLSPSTGKRTLWRELRARDRRRQPRAALYYA